jgi:Icc-related predicted phosphoesterase
MKIVLISDTHEKHEQLGELPDGDVLIHAGDYTSLGEAKHKTAFYNWFFSQPHPYKIYVAGNHDFGEPERPMTDQEHNFYLYDSEVVIEGLKFWGSPWTPRFGPWAFMYDRLTTRWNVIPEDTDVLITHGPPMNMLDKPYGHQPGVGCFDLLERVLVVKPKLHVFGHIHGSYGMKQLPSTLFVNASVVDEAYQVRNAPLVVELEAEEASTR